jgi:hypothetical protein
VSASLASKQSRSVLRAGSLTHRYAGATGTSITKLLVVGVRCDDDDPSIGDATLFTMRPGRADAVARIPFPVVSLGSSGDAVLLLDGHGRLWRTDSAAVDATAKAVSVVDEAGPDVVQVVGPWVRRRDGTVVRVDDAGAVVAITTGARVIGQADHGVVVAVEALSSGGLVAVGRDGVGVEQWRITLPVVDDDVVAVAVDGGAVGLVAGRTLMVGPQATGEFRRLPLVADVVSLARLGTRWVLGSPSAGLFTLDDDDDRVTLWRPSLRAHQVLRLHDGIVAVSDLFVATSDDGIDLVSRDLTGFMRLAET